MGKLKLKGKLIRVLDGDTLEVAIKVRMAKIDAPETKGVEKELGEEAKAYLKNRLQPGETLEFNVIANDIYYRALSYVQLDGVDIGEEMLDKKLVEVYTPKNHNNGVLDV